MTRCAVAWLMIVMAFCPSGRTQSPTANLPTGAVLRLGTTWWRASGSVVMMTWSTDGKELLTVGNDRILSIWDAETGREKNRLDVGGPPVGSSPNIPSLRPAVSADRRKVACLGRDGVLRVWDVAQRLAVFETPAAQVTRLALSPDGKLLATFNNRAQLQIYSVAEKKLLKELVLSDEARPTRVVNFLEFSPDGRTLLELGASFSPAGAIRPNVVKWDVETGQIKLQLRDSIKNRTDHLAFPTPDHRRLLLRDAQGIVVIDLEEDREIDRLRDIPELAVSTFVVRSEGRELVQLIGRGNAVIVWDLGEGKVVQRLGKLTEAPTRQLPTNVALSPDERWLAYGDGLTIQLIDLTTGQRRGGAGHRSGLLSAYYSPDGQSILTRSQESYCRWDATTGAPLQTFELQPPHTSFLLTRDMKWLVASNPNMSLHIIDAATMKETRVIALNLNQSFTYSCAPDSRSVIVMGQQIPVMHVYDLISGEKKWECPIPVSRNPGFQSYNPLPRRISISRDARLVAGSVESAVVVFDIVMRRVIQRIDFGAGQTLRQMSFSPDNRLLALEFYDGEVALWELASGTRRLFLEKPREADGGVNLQAVAQGQVDGSRLPSALAFGPDGSLVANATTSGLIRIYDSWTGKRLGSLEGHRLPVTSLSFSPDGTRLVSAGADASALVWDTTPLRAEPTPSDPTTAPSADDVWSILADPDAAKVHPIAQRLVSDPQKTLELFRDRIRPAASLDESHLAKLVAELESPRYAIRQRARQELERLGDAAIPALRMALEQGGAEARAVARRLLDSLSIQKLTGEQVRQIRAIEILERLRDPEAVAILRDLAKGGATAISTQEARRALERLTEKR